MALLSFSTAAVFLSGCAGSSATSSAGTAPAFIVGTDAPLASVTSFSVQMDSIVATTASGTSVDLLSGTPTVDFARFNGLQTLLDMNDVPAGTYTSVTITLGPATIGYLNTSGTGAPTMATEAATFTSSTVTKTLATPLTLSASGPVGLHLDFDLHDSIQTSGGQITGTVTPTFNIGVVGPNDPGAYIDQFDAAVVSVNASGNSFVVQGPHGRNFTVNVSSSTAFDNNESLASLTTSSIVELSGVLDRADATIDPDEVAILSQNGFYAGGLVTYVNPSTGPATSFDFYVHGLLPTTTGLTLGSLAQVNLSGSENFFVHRMHDPLTQYLFNNATMLPGQHIAVGGPASGAANPNAVTVNRVVLRQRGYNGTVISGTINATSNTFQMQIGDFAGLLVPQTVTVYLDGNTGFRNGPVAIGSLQSGQAVRVVGLLMKIQSTGQTIMLARYVDDLI